MNGLGSMNGAGVKSALLRRAAADHRGFIEIAIGGTQCLAQCFS
jgi:hypothetical protein